MAQELAVVPGGVGVGADMPSPATGAEGGLQERRRDRFAVRREVLAVGELSALGRRILARRLASELDAVRHVLAKVELFSSGVVGAGVVCAAAAPAGGGRLVAAEAAVEDDGGGGAAKKRKLASWDDSIPPKRVTPDDRDRLARRLAALASRLPDRAVEFLQDEQRGLIGDAADPDPHGDGGEVEMDLDTNVPAVKCDGSLVQLKMLLDRFVPLRSTPPAKCHGHGRMPLLAASSVSCQSQHEEACDKMDPMQEEGVDICGGVSQMTIRDMADEYGKLVADIGVPRLLSPLQRKYVDLAEQGEYYVDICGDASPVVFPEKPGDGNSSLGLSGSGSDASSTDSDSSSGDSEMDRPNEPPPPEPAPKALPVAKPVAEVQAVSRPTVTTPAPEPLQVAEPVAEVQATSTPTTPALILISRKPHVPVVLPEENDICAPAPPEPVAPEMGPNEPPPEPAPEEAMQIAEPVEEVQAMSTPTTPAMILISSSPHVPAALPKENDICAPVPPEPPAAETVPQLLPSPTPLAELIAMAQEAAEQRRQAEKERFEGEVECARVKARRELLEVERAAAALPDERIHPLDMELLGIAVFEHVVSTTVRAARTPTAQPQPQVNVAVGPRISPGHPSILQQLGVYLKADDGGEEEEDQQPPPGFVASDGEHAEIEDGEIL